VEVKRIGQHIFSNATEQMILEDGDIVRTGTNSFARIKYHNLTYQIILRTPCRHPALSTTAEGGNHIEVASSRAAWKPRRREHGRKDETIIATDTARVKPSAATRSPSTRAPRAVTTPSSGGLGDRAAGRRRPSRPGGGVSVMTTPQGFATTDVLIPPPAAVNPKTSRSSGWTTRPAPALLRVDGGGTSPPVPDLRQAALLLAPGGRPDRAGAGSPSTVSLPAPTTGLRPRVTTGRPTGHPSTVPLQQIFQRPKIQRDLKLTVEATPIGTASSSRAARPGRLDLRQRPGSPREHGREFQQDRLFGEVGSHTVQVRAFDDEGNEATWRKQFRQPLTRLHEPRTNYGRSTISSCSRRP